MKFIGKVKNGNYWRCIADDGTLIKFNHEDKLIPEYPDSMDVKITNKCDMGCKFCLKSSAKIIVEGEVKSISDIEIGDKVLSVNIQNMQSEFKPVLKLYQRPYQGKLYIINDEFGNSITCTPNHKIYTKNRGFVRADELTIDDLLILD